MVLADYADYRLLKNAPTSLFRGKNGTVSLSISQSRPLAADRAVRQYAENSTPSFV